MWTPSIDPPSHRILEDVGISVNKNTVPGDKSALNPSGIRFGTPPLTTRGFKEADMERVVALIDRALDIAIDVQGIGTYRRDLISLQ